MRFNGAWSFLLGPIRSRNPVTTSTSFSMYFCALTNPMFGFCEFILVWCEPRSRSHHGLVYLALAERNTIILTYGRGL